MRSCLIGFVVLCLASSVVLAGVPGDVNGDGVADAADVSCAVQVAFDPTASCATAQSDYVRTIVVSPVVGDSIASGTRLVDLLDGITDASPVNQYLLKVEPGVYYLTAGRRVVMTPFVDIEGSGEAVTVISRAGSPSLNTGTVVGADNAELRNITIENIGTTDYAVAIYNNSASPGLSHVTATARGGTQGNVGVYNFQSTPRTRAVTVAATGGQIAYGVYNNDCSPLLRELDVEAADGTSWSFAVYNYNGAEPLIEDSSLRVSGPGNGHTIRNTASASVELVRVTAIAEMGGEGIAVYSLANNAPRSLKIVNSVLRGGFSAIAGGDTFMTIYVGASQLDGGIYNFQNSVYHCAAAFDGGFLSLSSSCQ